MSTKKTHAAPPSVAPRARGQGSRRRSTREPRPDQPVHEMLGLSKEVVIGIAKQMTVALDKSSSIADGINWLTRSEIERKEAISMGFLLGRFYEAEQHRSYLQDLRLRLTQNNTVLKRITKKVERMDKIARAASAGRPI